MRPNARHNPPSVRWPRPRFPLNDPWCKETTQRSGRCCLLPSIVRFGRSTSLFSPAGSDESQHRHRSRNRRLRRFPHLPPPATDTSNAYGMIDLNAIALKTSPAYTLGTEHQGRCDHAHFLRPPEKRGADLSPFENAETSDSQLLQRTAHSDSRCASSHNQTVIGF